MNNDLINELINTLKMIFENKPDIDIPPTGGTNKIELKSNKYKFFVDLNRKGHLKPKVTFQLREQQYKDTPLLRLDLIGKPHPNPQGDFPHAGELISCPHLHIAHPDYGTSIAYPLNSECAKMVLNEDDKENLILADRKSVV